MASRQKQSDAKRQSESGLKDRTSLPGALYWALSRLVRLEGGVNAAARILKLPPRRLGSWLSRGVPASVASDAVAFDRLLTAVYAGLARWDQDSPTRARRVQRLAYSGLLDPKELEKEDDPRAVLDLEVVEQKAAFARLLLVIARYDREGAARGLSRGYGVRTLAGWLGVKPGRVRAWLKKGRFVGLGLQLFLRFEERQGLVESREAKGKEAMAELIRLGSIPATRDVETTRRDRKTGRRVRHIKKVPEPLVPKIKSRSYRYGGDQTSGWRWDDKIGEFLDWPLVQRMVEFARGVTRVLPRWLPLWRITAFTSIISTKPHKSGDEIREDIAEQHELGRDFIVKAVISGGSYKERERAITGFVARCREELENGDVQFVHGMSVWNYRVRGLDETASRVEARRLDRLVKDKREKRLVVERVRRAKVKKRRVTRDAILKARVAKTRGPSK